MKLRSTVVLRDDKGQVHSFGPDSDVPAWAVEQIPNPKAWADEGNELEDEPVEDLQRPPTSGKGSGLAEWQAYAKARGLSDEDLEGASRDDLIATLTEE